jgi:hypothetical protein
LSLRGFSSHSPAVSSVNGSLAWFMPRFARAIAELAAPLRPATASGELRFGLDDPALTGECLGVLCAMRLWPGRVWREVRIVPDFDHPALELSGQASWVIRPARVLWPVVTLAAAPASWRAVRAARDAGRTGS